MKKISILMSFSLLLLALAPMALAHYQIMTASAADGSNGTIEVSANQVFKDTTVTIHLASLDTSSDYGITFTTGSGTAFNFSTSARETKKDFTVKITSPSSGSISTIALVAKSTQTTIDSVDVRVRDGNELIPSDFILSVMAPLLILIIVAALVGNFVRGARE